MKIIQSSSVQKSAGIGSPLDDRYFDLLNRGEGMKAKMLDDENALSYLTPEETLIAEEEERKRKLREQQQLEEAARFEEDPERVRLRQEHRERMMDMP